MHYYVICNYEKPHPVKDGVRRRYDDEEDFTTYQSLQGGCRASHSVP